MVHAKENLEVFVTKTDMAISKQEESEVDGALTKMGRFTDGSVQDAKRDAREGSGGRCAVVKGIVIPCEEDLIDQKR